MNDHVLAQLIYRNMKTTRPILEPNWMMPCTGISAAGGTRIAMTASSRTPPPIPNAMVMKDAAVLAANMTRAAVGSTLGGMRKSNKWFICAFAKLAAIAACDLLWERASSSAPG